jgi:hypothetical protein
MKPLPPYQIRIRKRIRTKVDRLPPTPPIGIPTLKKKVYLQPEVHTLKKENMKKNKIPLPQPLAYHQ